MKKLVLNYEQKQEEEEYLGEGGRERIITYNTNITYITIIIHITYNTCVPNITYSTNDVWRGEQYEGYFCIIRFSSYIVYFTKFN